MTDAAELLLVVISVIQSQVGPDQHVAAESQLSDDLGLDSLDIMECAFAVEDRLGAQFTVQDLPVGEVISVADLAAMLASLLR